MSENVLERLNELPENLANHIMITVIALAAGIGLSVPMAVWVARRRGPRYALLTSAGVIQTIPSLALLALMVPLIDATAGLGLGLPAFGFWPATIALVLYSMLPVLRNTVTGILGVEPDLIEAARGVGMTDRQILRRVELPLAAPIIIAGVRTATVWVVGIATLATPVGQRCLGNYIFAGLQTRNWTMVLFGVVAAAALAIILDLLIGALQRAWSERRRGLGAAAVAGLTLVVLTGMLSPAIARQIRAGVASAGGTGAAGAGAEAGAERRVVRIGAKTFTEQYILAELIGLRLEAAGFAVERAESLGSIVVFDALAGGYLDVYVDYSGTIWANTMGRDEVAPPWLVIAAMNGWLAERHRIRTLGALGFENAYALAMRRAHAEQLGIRTIADLAAHAGSMRIGGDYEFFGRPEWRRIRDSYGLGFAEQVSFDSTLMYEAAARGQVDVISAFSSDGRIAALDLVVLADPQRVIPPYDAVLLLGPSVADDEDVAAALQLLVGAIPVDLMREANNMVDRAEDKRTPAQAAGWLLGRIESGGR